MRTALWLAAIVAAASLMGIQPIAGQAGKPPAAGNATLIDDLVDRKSVV